VLVEPAQADAQARHRRVQWIKEAIAPLKTQLEPAAWKRLVTGSTVGVGIEAMLVMRDIHGMTAAQAIHVCQWMSVALVREALANRQPVASGSGRTRKRSGKSER
jgi:hypothetical protein